MEALFILGIIVVVVLLSFVKQIEQYQRGILFTFGKFTKVLDAGWHIILPVLQRIEKVDIRVKAVDVPNQEVITKDNIPVEINAVVYYKIENAERAILEVENFYNAVSQLAQTSMRNAVGEKTLDELLQQRSKIAEEIKKELDLKTDPWGVDVQALELKDVIIPEQLKRTISKVAEAEREKQAGIIKSEGDKMSAANLAAAAAMLAASPGALHLRTLQTINDLSSDESNTTIWMLPIEVLEAMKGVGSMFSEKKH